MALPISAWAVCFLGSTVVSVTASCPGALWVPDHRHTASPDSNCCFTDKDLEVMHTLRLGSLQELLWRALAFPVLGQQLSLEATGEGRDTEQWRGET